jgi:hypothetical protein
VALVIKFFLPYHQSKIPDILYFPNTEGEGEAGDGGLSMSGGVIY